MIGPLGHPPTVRLTPELPTVGGYPPNVVAVGTRAYTRWRLPYRRRSSRSDRPGCGPTRPNQRLVTFPPDHGDDSRRTDQVPQVRFQNPVFGEQRRCRIGVADVDSRTSAGDQLTDGQLVLDVPEPVFHALKPSCSCLSSITALPHQIKLRLTWLAPLRRGTRPIVPTSSPGATTAPTLTRPDRAQPQGRGREAVTPSCSTKTSGGRKRSSTEPVE